MKRDEDFAGPSISILGATQLNGGVTGTLIVFAVVATLFRLSYEYFRLHADVPWVQVWWALTYYNAWFAVVADDPANWFYYNYGFTCLPMLTALWIINALNPAARLRVTAAVVPPAQIKAHGGTRMTVIDVSTHRRQEAAAQAPAAAASRAWALHEKIDICRGLFAVLVVVAHAQEIAFGVHPGAVEGPNTWPNWIATTVFGSGMYYVMGFFVLSGYCIHLSVARSMKADHFPVQRTWRRG